MEKQAGGGQMRRVDDLDRPSVARGGGGMTYRNDGVEYAQEPIGSAPGSLPADLGAKVVAHADAGIDAGVVHDAQKVIDKLRMRGEARQQC